MRGNQFWFELSGVSKNRGFEKSGFYCIRIKATGQYPVYYFVQGDSNQTFETEFEILEWDYTEMQATDKP